MSYAIFAKRKGKLERLPIEAEYNYEFEDFTSALRALLEISTDLSGHIVGFYSNPKRGVADVFVIVDGQPEEYIIKPVETLTVPGTPPLEMSISITPQEPIP